MADFEYIALSTKPTAQICYSLHTPAPHLNEGNNNNPKLVVFLNGLGLPQAFWLPTISSLKELYHGLGTSSPALLTYDRFGQGQTTDRDPQDESAADPSHGHDCLSAVQDLRQLIAQVVSERLSIADIDQVAVVLVANSIGAALARLYAQAYPGTVAGLLLLDSVLANSDFVSIFPDPDVDDFDAASLPPGITPETIRGAREGVRPIFHPDVGSKEGLSRRNLKDLLPASDSPVLTGPDGRGPFVTVVGHDFKTFEEEAEKMGRPRSLTRAYVNPYWHLYNEGLARITEPSRSRGPLQAPNSGHFIHKDNPGLVARELHELLRRIM